MSLAGLMARCAQKIVVVFVGFKVLDVTGVACGTLVPLVTGTLAIAFPCTCTLALSISGADFTVGTQLGAGGALRSVCGVFTAEFELFDA